MGYIWVTKNSALTQKCCIIVLSYSHLKPVENLSIGLKQPNQEPRHSNQSLKALGSRFPIQQRNRQAITNQSALGPSAVSTQPLPSGVFKGLLRLSVADQRRLPPRPPVFGRPCRGPRPYTISAVNSFGGSFVWVI